MNMTGASLIGNRDSLGAERFIAIDPSRGEPLEPSFVEASPTDVTAAASLAEAAFPVFRAVAPEKRALLLEAIATGIMELGDRLVERATAETGLPKGRIEGERGRTIGQLRLFARVLHDGDWTGVRVDMAMPDRMPLPRSDLRLHQIPLGPVAVFGASNFPLAFSVAGGDTAAALAAGCPVIVKGHPAHPGTSELVGRVIRQAVSEAQLPEGVFSLLTGTTNALGAALVTDPRIKAVGFTGSRTGGLALMRIAAARPVPIPVYAEMSSINPVFLLPYALDARAEALGKAFIGSLVMGAGQFCTNPGLVVGLEGPALDRFVGAAKMAIAEAPAATMLTPGIHDAYTRSLDKLQSAGARLLARGPAGQGSYGCQAALFATDAQSFLSARELADETFGAASVVIRCGSQAEMQAVAAGLEGQLTVTLQMDAGDVDIARQLLPILEEKAGRILANGWPTGVEVSDAMVHGGPFPATSDGRSTSVGTLAIDRFLRPVCYQDLPEALLPDAVKQANPLHLRRLVNGKPTSA